MTTLQPRLLARLDDLVRELLPEGTQSNGTYTHGTRQVHTANGLWTDTESEQSGDLIDLIAVVRCCTTEDAIAWANEWLGPVTPPAAAFDPLSVGYKRKSESVWRRGTSYHTYHSHDLTPVCWVVHFDNGDSIPLQVIDGKPKWRRPKPSPLYNLPFLREHKPILIVDTEDHADDAAVLFPNHTVITWIGGPSAIADTDWSPIVDDPVTPVTIYLSGDAATYLKARIPRAVVVASPVWPPTDQSIAAELVPASLVPVTAPFRCIGHDESGFFYHSYLSGYLVHLTAPEHTELNLQLLANDEYWKQQGFWSERSNGVDYRAVAKHLIATQFQTGHFDTNRVRGLGCWVEPGDPPSVIFHAGDTLYINGVPTPPHLHRSPFIYPRRRSIPVDLSRIATAADGLLIADACDLMPWDDNQMPWAFAAWHFLAPICGALDWRPPIWVTGPSTCGKSWIFANFTAPMLGESVVKILSATTAPGIRQYLSCDALPVAGDEIEPNNQRSQMRIAALCDLVRQATSETGGSIYHGTTDGSGRAYRIRSCFAFSSIVCGATETADENRFAKFQFRKRADADAFDRLCELCARIPDIAAAIRARAIALVPQILAAARIFTRSVARAARDSRKGQQFGTLAAGFWMLTNDIPPTQEQADAWCATVDWSAVGHDTDDDDSSRAIDVLMAYRTTMQDNDGRKQDATIGELIDIWFSTAIPADPRRDSAYEALMRLGVHPIGDSIDIAVRWPELRRVFASTQFADHWGDNLRQLQGSQDSTFRSAGNRVIRSVRIPNQP